MLAIGCCTVVVDTDVSEPGQLETALLTRELHGTLSAVVGFSTDVIESSTRLAVAQGVGLARPTLHA